MRGLGADVISDKHISKFMELSKNLDGGGNQNGINGK
jgi:hypothetical protein